jgi:hypothetical protein
MGRQTDGKKLLNELLKDEGRKFEVLMVVANTLRDLGVSPETRALTEEAYKTAQGSREKQDSAAELRALTAKDLDDKIEWLEKVTTRTASVRAFLAESKGYKAVEEGKDETAAGHFREALKIYKGEQENFAVLNNAALAALSLYSVTGEPAVLSDGVRMMEKAATLQPRDAILAGNIPRIALAEALRSYLNDSIDLKTLKMYGSLGLLSFLYQDDKEQQAIVRRLREDAGITRTRSRFDRAILLAPSNARHYSEYLELLDYVDDVKALETLARRADEATLEREQYRQDSLEAFQGKKDDKRLRTTMTAIERAEKQVKDTRAAGGATFAVAAQTLVYTRLSLEGLGKPIDGDALVKLAEEAHKAAPSSATAATLQSALLARAHQKLVALEPAYAAMAKRAQRSLGSHDLIAVAVWRPGKTRDAALANEDVKRAIELVRDQAHKFPESPGGRDWVLLHDSHPEDAKKVAEAIAKNTQGKIVRQLRLKLSPLSASQALSNCWALDSEGKHKEAQETLKRCAAEGVPMPFDVP